MKSISAILGERFSSFFLRTKNLETWYQTTGMQHDLTSTKMKTKIDPWMMMLFYYSFRLINNLSIM